VGTGTGKLQKKSWLSKVRIRALSPARGLQAASVCELNHSGGSENYFVTGPGKREPAERHHGWGGTPRLDQEHRVSREQNQKH